MEREGNRSLSHTLFTLYYYILCTIHGGEAQIGSGKSLCSSPDKLIIAHIHMYNTPDRSTVFVTSASSTVLASETRMVIPTDRQLSSFGAGSPLPSSTWVSYTLSLSSPYSSTLVSRLSAP